MIANVTANVPLDFDSVNNTLSIARIGESIRTLLKESGIKTVWLASQAPAAPNILRGVLGVEYELKGFFHEAGIRNYTADSDSMHELLTDIEALRRAHTFLGTATSNIGRLAY